MNRAIDASTAHESAIGGVDDGIDASLVISPTFTTTRPCRKVGKLSMLAYPSGANFASAGSNSS